MIMTDPLLQHALVDSVSDRPMFLRGERVLVLMGHSGTLQVSTRRVLPWLAQAGEMVGAELWVQFYDSVLHGVPVRLRPEALPEVVQGDLGHNLRKCLTEALGQSQVWPEGQALDRVVVGFDPFDAVVKPARWGNRVYPCGILVPEDADFTDDGTRRINPDRAVMAETTLRTWVERAQLEQAIQAPTGEPVAAGTGLPGRPRSRL